MNLIPLRLKSGKVINAASAVNALTSQGAHPCVDVERILKMLPRVPDDFEPGGAAIMPAFELDKSELSNSETA